MSKLRQITKEQYMCLLEAGVPAFGYNENDKYQRWTDAMIIEQLTQHNGDLHMFPKYAEDWCSTYPNALFVTLVVEEEAE
jgi:hypothetical protein